jgi:hypothetical protein
MEEQRHCAFYFGIATTRTGDKPGTDSEDVWIDVTLEIRWNPLRGKGVVDPGIGEAETVSFESSETKCSGRTHTLRPPFRPDVPETIELPDMVTNLFQRCLGCFSNQWLQCCFLEHTQTNHSALNFGSNDSIKFRLDTDVGGRK